jgi:hypothetical protein
VSWRCCAQEAQQILPGYISSVYAKPPYHIAIILPREHFRDYALLEECAGTIPRIAPRLDARAEFARRAFEEERADRLSVD